MSKNILWSTIMKEKKDNKQKAKKPAPPKNRKDKGGDEDRD